MKNPYQDPVTKLLDKIWKTQTEKIAEAAKICAEAIAAGRLVHLFGSGHSVIPVLDVFPRYGSFPGFHPLMDPRLMWSNVIGPGGVKELLWLERREGYAAVILESQAVRAGDVMVVYSHGGMNAVPVEMAAECRKRGLKVICVTSLDPGRSEQPRMAKHADVVIDNCAPSEDSLVNVSGWHEPVAAGSTAAAVVISMALVAQVATELATKGAKPPVFVSPNVAGVPPDHNTKVFEAYESALQRNGK